MLRGTGASPVVLWAAKEESPRRHRGTLENFEQHVANADLKFKEQKKQIAIICDAASQQERASVAPCLRGDSSFLLILPHCSLCLKELSGGIRCRISHRRMTSASARPTIWRWWLRGRWISARRGICWMK